jgi:hypothetical protein
MAHEQICARLGITQRVVVIPYRRFDHIKDQKVQEEGKKLPLLAT